MLSPEELADIKRFQEREGKRSKKEAVRELIRLGLRAANEFNPGYGNSNIP
jgi:hypothetical protein